MSNIDQLTPQERAEAIFAECAIVASKAEESERMQKLNQTKEAASQFLDYQVEYWNQVRAEWQNIIRLTEQKKS